MAHAQRAFGEIMKIGSIVRARHWQRGEVGVVVMDRKPRAGIVRVKIITPNGIMEIDQLSSDLEVV